MGNAKSTGSAQLTGVKTKTSETTPKTPAVAAEKTTESSSSPAVAPPGVLVSSPKTPTSPTTPPATFESFEVILSPAQRSGTPRLSSAGTPTTPLSEARLVAKQEAAAERRRRSLADTVEKAEKLEKGPASKRTREPEGGEADEADATGAAAIAAKQEEAEAKRAAHLAARQEKARACTTPKASPKPLEGGSPSPAEALRAKQAGAEERREALRHQMIRKLHLHEERIANALANATAKDPKEEDAGKENTEDTADKTQPASSTPADPLPTDH